MVQDYILSKPFVEEKKMSEEEKKHVCAVCNWEYDGSEGPFEDLPDDYVCPICGVDKSNFS